MRRPSFPQWTGLGQSQFGHLPPATREGITGCSMLLRTLEMPLIIQFCKEIERNLDGDRAFSFFGMIDAFKVSFSVMEIIEQEEKR